MDFPHHHHRRDEDEFPPPGRPHPPSYYDSEPAPPPPPEVTRVFHNSHSGPGEYGYGPTPPPPQATNVYHSSHSGPGEYGYAPAPPPPQVSNVYHSSHSGPGEYGYAPAPPPPQVSNVYHSSHSGHGDFVPPPPTMDAYSSVEHVGHVSQHSFTPHMPSFMHHHSHHNAEISNKPSVRMYSKAEQNYSLTIRDGKVILAPSDPSDPYQHWIKDEKYSTRVKDEEGFPSFALVNKATGQAMKHSTGATQPVQLIPYNPDVLDESILWTESRDLGDTYRTIRMVNNIRLNVDAFNGDRNHGGVRNGTPIVLWEWKKGDNQRWKIVPS